MSVIQSPTVVPINNLPPPTTSATTQVFTDVNGEQWVARASIAGGVWKRARDGLFGVAYLSAAYNVPTANSVFPYDTVKNDNYGMWTAASHGFTLAATGWWLCQAAICGGSAANSYMQMYIFYNGVAASSDNILQSAATGMYCRTQCLLLMPAGTIINVYAYESTSVGATTGNDTRIEVAYLGSGV